MKLHVDVQTASAGPVPDAQSLRRWVAAALRGRVRGPRADLTVRLVEREEMSRLNATYRGVEGPTNVLSFPADLPPELAQPLLGDIVICAPVVRAEAREQGVDPEAHWAHMAVHGALHLLGYDHTTEREARVMEALESDILRGLDYPCPYGGVPEPGEELA